MPDYDASPNNISVSGVLDAMERLRNAVFEGKQFQLHIWTDGSGSIENPSGRTLYSFTDLGDAKDIMNKIALEYETNLRRAMRKMYHWVELPDGTYNIHDGDCKHLANVTIFDEAVALVNELCRRYR